MYIREDCLRMSQDSNSSCRRLPFCTDRRPAAITPYGDDGLFSGLVVFLLAVRRGALVVTVAVTQVCSVIVLTVYALVVTPVFTVCTYHASYSDTVIFNFFSALKKAHHRQARRALGTASGHGPRSLGPSICLLNNAFGRPPLSGAALRRRDCVVKGGMAAPFHLYDKALQRLSVDIDTVTGHSREEVVEPMKKVSEKLKDAATARDPRIPSRNTNKRLPPLTCFCGYRSSIEENPERRIGIFYWNETRVKSKKIESRTKVVGL